METNGGLVVSTFASKLEKRIKTRSEQLEEVHFEAAMDAQLISISTRPKDNPIDPTHRLPVDIVTQASSVLRDLSPPELCKNNGNDDDEAETNHTKKVIFDDHTNPNAVENCLSPFVPLSSDRIDAFLAFANITSSDVLLDIGCGDGRVCISAAKITGCQSIGIDVSPPCISMAKELAKEEGLDDKSCIFYEADATLDPNILLDDSHSLANALQSVTVIYLYTYPTLLDKLIPLLAHMSNTHKNLRAVATLTYHLPEDQVLFIDTDATVYDMRVYSNVFVSKHQRAIN